MLTKKRLQRKTRIRSKVSGTESRPRLSVFRSNMYVYVQAIDDTKGITLASAKGKSAKEVGTALAKALEKKKITQAVFDRGGYRYHGNLKILADTIRESGIAM